MGRSRTNKQNTGHNASLADRMLLILVSLVTAAAMIGLIAAVGRASPARDSPISRNLERVDMTPSVQAAAGSGYVIDARIEQSWDEAIADKEATQPNDGVVPERNRRVAERPERPVDVGLGFSLSTPVDHNPGGGYMPFPGWDDICKSGALTPGHDVGQRTTVPVPAYRTRTLRGSGFDALELLATM